MYRDTHSLTSVYTYLCTIQNWNRTLSEVKNNVSAMFMTEQNISYKRAPIILLGDTEIV